MKVKEFNVGKKQKRFANPKSIKDFDVIVIGSGSGLSISSDAAARGLKVAVIEPGPFGGTCLNKGCIPSKMFIHSADVMETIKHAGEFGIKVPKGVTVNWSQIQKRVWGIIDLDAKNIEKANTSNPNITVFKHFAHFVDKKVLRVGNQLITGKKIFICAGGRPRVPRIEGLDKVTYFTSDDIMRLKKQPKKMVVIGGGYIANEMSHFFGSLGTKITMVVRSKMLKNEDEEISTTFEELVSKKFNVLLGTNTDKVYKKGNDIVVEVSQDGKKKRITCDTLFVAVGRVPNTDSLKVEKTGLQVNKHGYFKVNDFMETEVKGIWAIGDIAGKHFFKHSANVEAGYASYNAFNPKNKVPVDYSAMPHAVFASPQIAGVGYREQDLKAQNIAYTKSVYYYKDTAMGEAINEHRGFVKVLAEPHNRHILGCHIIGPEASILIHEVVPIMRANLPVGAIGQAIHAHPALSEVVERAFNSVE